jgi:hypothetical protein
MESRMPAAPASSGTFAAYLPLLAAFLTIPWFMTVVFDMITRGAHTLEGANPRAVAFVSTIPAMAGLVAGILVIARGQARRGAQRVCLILGCAVCGLIVVGSWRGILY